MVSSLLKVNGLTIILTLFFAFTSFAIVEVLASPTVMIYPDRTTYSYGDYLSITIEVSEVIDETAILHISDEFGKGSSAIPIPISEQKTEITFPFPFESSIYPEGKYFLEIQYAGITNSTEYNLVDSGKIVIPYLVKDLLGYWYIGKFSDNEYADGIGILIEDGIIVVPEAENQEESEVKIPDWIKTNTKWWLEGKISDAEYAQGIEYLIKAGVIII